MGSGIRRSQFIVTQRVLLPYLLILSNTQKTKHIDIRYHFLKDHVEKENIELYFVCTEFQLAGLFTKALDEKRIIFLVSQLGMMNLQV